MQKYLAFLLTVAPFLLTDPPVPPPKPSLKELSPVKKETPPPGVPVMVDVAKYRFYTVDGYTGPVTWIVKGSSVGIKEVDKPLTLFGLVQGQTDPGEYTIPANAVIVWGKSQGTTEVQALGVVDGKAAILLSLAFQTGPAPPEPEPVPPGPAPPGPVPPAPQPVTTFRVIFVTESSKNLTVQQNAVATAKAVGDYLNAKTTKDGTVPGWRYYDPQTTAANEYAGLKAVWDAAKVEAAKSVPCMVIQRNEKIDVVPYPKNAAEALTTLQTYGGK